MVVKGFGGLPISDSRQYPFGMEFFEEQDCSSLLPIEAGTRFKLVLLLPGRHNYGPDPYVLYDRWGAILHVWPDDYVPTLQEVKDVCTQFLKK